MYVFHRPVAWLKVTCFHVTQFLLLPPKRRSCQNYLSLLQWVEHHGLGELFTSSVQHRVRTRDSVVYNEYNWNGQVYDHDSWTQVRGQYHRDAHY